EEVSIVKASNKVFKDQSVKSLIEELGYTASENGSNVVVSKPQRGKTAQEELKIVATVIDTLGEPLAGVAILVKGTTRGTSTDLNGNFVLTAPADAVLVFTYVSFRTLEGPVNGRSTLNVTLEESDSALEEVVIVGFGTQRKISLVGAQSSVTAEKLQVPVANLSNALAGQLAGVVSVQRSEERRVG